MFGQVVLQPKQAEIFINVEHKDHKMDPYVSFQVGQQCKKTKEHKDGHKNPVWNDIITLECNGEELMFFKVMDDRFFKDKYIGEGQISLLECMQSGHVMNWYPIYDNGGNQVGKLLLDVTTQPVGMKAQQGMGMGQQMGLGVQPNVQYGMQQPNLQSGMQQGKQANMGPGMFGQNQNPYQM